MASQKEIRTRIQSVQKTQKITSAMKVVSAAKLARAQHAVQAARPYADKLASVLASVAGGVDPDAHALLTPRPSVRRLDIALFTSDRGLCGAFNTNLVKRAEELIAERRGTLDEVNVIPVGRRGADHFRRRRYAFPHEHTGIAVVTPELAAEIGSVLMRRYLQNETDEVVLVYAEFKSVMTQIPRVQPLLPVSPTAHEQVSGRHEIEPSAESLLGVVLPRAVDFEVYHALLETAAGEHGARMSAMDAATENCEELIRELTLDMNKARQAQITQELSEIVGGAQAL